MAISEKPVMEATLLAIEQINANGGILGHQLKPIIADGASDPQQFAEQAERMISNNKVAVIFGCWTSASRKRVNEVINQHGNLLFYPVQYEGLEASSRVVYIGATPNQQIIPAITWSLRHLGKRVYLIGSDYIFPHIANWLIRKQVAILGGEVVGESYVRLGNNDFSATIADIQQQQPELIINTINGSSLKGFFTAFAQHWDAKDLPILSFSMSETEIEGLQLQQAAAGHYVSWSYLQSLENAENEKFSQSFQQRYGQDRVLSDPMESAWVGVYLWADAVRAASTFASDNVLASIRHRSLLAPEGIISVDHNNLHSWRMARIAQADPYGQFQLRWQSEQAIRPAPFPLFIQRTQAKQKLAQLRRHWQGKWSAP